jgi:hypothetical protein
MDESRTWRDSEITMSEGDADHQRPPPNQLSEAFLNACLARPRRTAPPPPPASAAASHPRPSHRAAVGQRAQQPEDDLRFDDGVRVADLRPGRIPELMADVVRARDEALAENARLRTRLEEKDLLIEFLCSAETGPAPSPPGSPRAAGGPQAPTGDPTEAPPDPDPRVDTARPAAPHPDDTDAPDRRDEEAPGRRRRWFR